MIVAIAVIAGMGLVKSAHATTYTPQGSACLDDTSTSDPDPYAPGTINECDGSYEPSAHSGITRTFALDEASAMFSEIVFFIPQQWGISSDAEITDGTFVGEFNARPTLGLLNSGCDFALPFVWNLYEATTDQSQLVSYTNQFTFNGSYPRGVTEYPEYLTEVWVSDVNNSSTTLQPIARYYGQKTVIAFDVSVSLGIFPPGTTIRNHTFSPDLGYPMVFTLDAIDAPGAFQLPLAVTDYCTPAQASLSIYNSVRSNPPEGSYAFTTFSTSLRDADEDGFDNRLDTCPLIPNPDWDPRDNTIPDLVGDSDRDGIPDNCDPLPDDNSNPGVGAINDHDGDDYYNRQDNCPFDPNGLVVSNPPTPDLNTQRDDDGDGIGNVCDPHPNTPDGEKISACNATIIQIGVGGSPAVDPSGLAPCSAGETTVECLNCGDADSDGVLDAFDNCIYTPNPGQQDYDNDGIGDACEPVGGIIQIVTRPNNDFVGGLLAVVVLILGGVVVRFDKFRFPC